MDDDSAADGMSRYYVSIGRPSWSAYEEHVVNTMDEVLSLHKRSVIFEHPTRVIYGVEMDFEPAVVVETYRLVPRARGDIPTES